MPPIKNPLTRAIQQIDGGVNAIAQACEVTYQSVRKWERAGRLPRSEFVGETDYAKRIEALTSGTVTEAALLEWSRAGWKSTAAA